MRKLRRPTVFAGVVATATALLILSACGGNLDEPAATSTEPAEISEPVAPDPAPEPPPPAEPVEPPAEEPPAPPEPEPPAPEPDPPPEPVEEPPAPAAPAPAEEPPAADEITTASGLTCTNTRPEPRFDRPSFDAPFELALTDGATYTAVLETACGTVTLELDTANAPITTNNFIELARVGFYDGLTFHRAVPGFVIQGGDPNGNGTGGPGYQFEDELPTDGYQLGDLAMANAGPNTNGSQFFIVTGDASFLPNDFTRFGAVTEGLDVALAIESLGDPSVDARIEPIYIYSVTITES